MDRQDLARNLSDPRRNGFRATVRTALVLDLVAIIFIGVVGWLYLLCHADSIAIAHDGFLLTYWLERGALPAVALDFPLHLGKIAARLFVGLPWNLARALTGGSVTGYNLFQFWTLIASAILVYLIVRTIMPDRRGWALAAGALKVAWSANLEVLVNHSLHIYFAEALLWLAVLIFTTLLYRKEPLARPAGVLLLAFMVAANYVVIGSYETAWPLAFLIPVMALALRPHGPVPQEAIRVVAVWYGSLILGVATYLAYVYLSPLVGDTLSKQVTIAPAGIHWDTLGHRVLTGLVNLVDSSFSEPIGAGMRWARGDRNNLLGLSTQSAALTSALLAACLAVLVAGIDRCKWIEPVPERPSTPRMIAVLIGLGLVVTLVGVVPPSVKFDIIQNRLIHFSTIGAIMVLVGLAMGVARLGRGVGTLAAASLLAVVFWGNLFQLDRFAVRDGTIGVRQRDLFAQIAATVPALPEGTVVVMENPPTFFAFADHFNSLVLRAITNTRRTYLLTEHPPARTPNGHHLVVQTDVAMGDNRNIPDAGLTYPRGSKLCDHELERSQVIWLAWRTPENRLVLVEPELDRAKILPGTSAYGVRLYGDAARPGP